MLKKSNRLLMNEKETYNDFIDRLFHPRKRADFMGRFYPAACFDCPKKKDEVLNSFYLKIMKLEGEGEPDLRACKVCVKYAMRLSEMRKQLTGIERFFQPKK